MRIVFFGTPEFAVPSLQSLLAQPDFQVTAVVSQPDRPQGRGQKLLPTPVKQVASGAGIPVWQPERLRKSPETLAALAAEQADVFVVVAYGQILPPAVLSMPRWGCVNVHGSLLPAYRGAAPIQWSIARGETETGITTMLMDEGMDTGSMLLKATLPIGLDQTGTELAALLAPLGANLLVETLRPLGAGTLTPLPQDSGLATYAPLLTKAHFLLDWTQPASTVHNQIRGFSPHCFTHWNGEYLKVIRSSRNSGWTDPPGAQTPGQVVALAKGKGFWVQTGSEPLLITEVQPAGKRIQSAWDFANGARIQIDQAFE